MPIHPAATACTCLTLLTIPVSAASSVIFTATGGVVPGEAYSNPEGSPTSSEETHTDSEGFVVTKRSHAADFTNSRTVETELGGGWSETRSTHRLTSEVRQRQSETAAEFRFEGSATFSSSLEFSRSSGTYGNFFFVTSAEESSSLDLTRSLRFVADQPYEILLNFSSDPDGSFVPSILMFGGEVSFANLHFAYSPGGPTDRSGEKNGIRHSSTGSLADGTLGLRILVEPVDAGSPTEMELRWTMRKETTYTIARVIPGSESRSASGSFTESVVLRAVPEPAVTAFAPLAVLLCVWRRKRGQATLIFVTRRSRTLP